MRPLPTERHHSPFPCPHCEVCATHGRRGPFRASSSAALWGSSRHPFAAPPPPLTWSGSTPTAFSPPPRSLCTAGGRLRTAAAPPAVPLHRWWTPLRRRCRARASLHHPAVGGLAVRLVQTFGLTPARREQLVVSCQAGADLRAATGTGERARKRCQAGADLRADSGTGVNNSLSAVRLGLTSGRPPVRANERANAVRLVQTFGLTPARA